MDVGAWLHGLGLGQYERALRDNDVVPDLLAKLTAEDLKEIGVASVGHRRRLLEAIATLRADAAPPTVPSTETLRPAFGAERRQLTVMFVDLIGSTALAARFDPEDVRTALRAYQDACAGAIGRFDGVVAKFMGDGVLAHFGFPRAHEDDPERAVRAGLAVVRAVTGLRAPDSAPLAARVGIATGLVVVGDLIGSGPAEERAVVGGTPNLAARLQALAPAGGVVIAEATRRLLGDPFELEDLGPQAVKGLTAPVRAFRVGAERGGLSRFDARYTGGGHATPMVGRGQELRLLLERWRGVRVGEGQAVLLTGEPGIGKSRLVRALSEALADEAHVPVRCHCSPYHADSALWPVIRHLGHAARLEADDGPEDRLARLEALLRADPAEAARTVTLVAALLGVETEGRYPPLDLTPQERRAATLEVLTNTLLALATAKPVLLVVEDVHWIDPTTLELVRNFLNRIAAAPVLVLLTARPEFREDLGAHAHLAQLGLNRLGRGHAAAIVGGVAGDTPLPEEVRAEIVRRTDGVPLFVEELTKAMVESGLVEERAGRFGPCTPLLPLAVPATLHDSLMARLDCLAPVKELAQLAACLGREFDHSLLAAVTLLSEAELGAALDQLVAAELVFRHGEVPEAVYAFKHALVRDAAHDSLLKSRRRQLHARVATVLEERFPKRAEAEPELLAVHCSEAGLAARAAAHRLRAGQQALAGSAIVEAVAQFGKGIEALQALPPGRERSRLELELQAASGSASMSGGGWGVSETGRAFARAGELCRELGETARLFPILWGLAVYHVNRAELPAALEAAAELMRLAEGRSGDGTLLMAAHRVLGAVRYHLGELEQARRHCERVLTLYDEAEHRRLVVAYVADFRVVALCFLSHVLFFLGYPDQARASSAEALAHARGIAHLPSLRFALSWACKLASAVRDADAALAHAEACVALCAEKDFADELTEAAVDLACARAKLGAVGALAAAGEAFAAYRAKGQDRPTPLWLILLAEANSATGRPTEGLRLLEEPLDRIERTGEGWMAAELHRLRGELLMAVPEPDQAEAEACLRRSLAVARAQRAKIWELRAAASLAKLWIGQGRRHEARGLLAPVYDWFTEGFDAPDLKEAKALLQDLAATPPRPRARPSSNAPADNPS